MQNSLIGKGFGIAKDFLGRVMPINERAIMENEARGAGIFTDDIGRIVTDDYNTAGGIMAGYNLNKIDAGSFQKRRDTINEKMSDRINPETGKTFKQERLDLLDEAEAQILGARKKTKQVYKMRKDKKDADKKRREEEKAAAAAAKAAEESAKASAALEAQRRGRRPGSGGDGPTTQDTASSQGLSPGSPGAGTGGYSYDSGGRKGFGYGLADGGRVYYMDGGLADMLEIYD
jgi:membrane protein involved in colicin uptake